MITHSLASGNVDIVKKNIEITKHVLMTDIMNISCKNVLRWMPPGLHKVGTLRISPCQAEPNNPINCQYFQLENFKPILHRFGLFMVDLYTEW